MIEEIINKRHSVRKFKGGRLLTETITEAIRLASKAPSAGGLRAYYVVIVGDNDGLGVLAKYAKQEWIAKASLVVVICIDPEKSAKRYGDRGKNLYCIQDATLFGAYLDLLLVEKGYGTCWVGSFKWGRVKEYLKLPEHLTPISFLVVGEEDVAK